MRVKNDHRSKFSNLSNWKEEAWKKRKNQGFNGIRTRDLRVTGALLYQLSYEATHWEWGHFDHSSLSSTTAVQKWIISYTSHNLCMLRVLSAQGKLVLMFCSKWRYSRVWRDSRVSKVRIHSTWNNLICSVAKQVWSVGDKTHNIAFQLVLKQCWKTSCMFVLPSLP